MGMKSVLWCVVLLGTCGCDVTLNEVRSKWKTGPEWRRRSNGNSEVRWTAQTGLEGSFSNGHKVGVTYRSRNVSDSDNFAQRDDGVWVEYSFPLWRAEKKKGFGNDDLIRRLDELEAEVAELRAAQNGNERTG
jgi:hypothetical protein